MTEVGKMEKNIESSKVLEVLMKLEGYKAWKSQDTSRCYSLQKLEEVEGLKAPCKGKLIVATYSGYYCVICEGHLKSRHWMKYDFEF